MSQPGAVIVGISGPSSSGKTTLARLLQRVFCGVSLGEKKSDANARNLNTFIIHEDDFYYPDDKIPYTTTPSGSTIQDWDTAAAIDTAFLAQALQYVREHGTLPPRLRSKEDLNEDSGSGVADTVVAELREGVARKFAATSVEGNKKPTTMAFLEGFLLYSPSTENHNHNHNNNQNNALRPVHDIIHLRLFLPASYSTVKSRREGRSGYVTIGPAPAPPSTNTTTTTTTTSTDGTTDTKIDLHQEDDRPPQNFWTDPPGYVDDIVWPRYVRDHAWLLLPDSDTNSNINSNPNSDPNQPLHLMDLDDAELLRWVGDGTRLRTDAGVEVAPGWGRWTMEEVLRWAVERVVGYYLAQ
ncbi:Phosphoribulokinase/uridine kinase [Penicillium alfredii]|uniref:Phosphoribulokinase/uridine kinase n=1 Tax=Penicillium alfredii TaxID=1506179 RepID=A0A9W9FK40_9EURO|nr:Phosphoribulokinase/uridine kinase [Penicillium alfredii]KAJ5101666.1 Phosphoribulokinase/uridine kinase [Penicillium alfredii]